MKPLFLVMPIFLCKEHPLIFKCPVILASAFKKKKYEAGVSAFHGEFLRVYKGRAIFKAMNSEVHGHHIQGEDGLVKFLPSHGSIWERHGSSGVPCGIVTQVLRLHLRPS